MPEYTLSQTATQTLQFLLCQEFGFTPNEVMSIAVESDDSQVVRVTIESMRTMELSRFNELLMKAQTIPENKE